MHPELHAYDMLMIMIITNSLLLNLLVSVCLTYFFYSQV